MLARVSNLEEFRYWQGDEDSTVEDLVERLTNFVPTERMLAGTAFHKALELAQPGEFATLEAEGFVFHMADSAIQLADVRELRCFGKYGPLTVTGKVDELHGKRVIDHKTTGQFDADRYLTGYQWRFYLDIFGADVFRWNVFVIREVGERTYEVEPPQILEQYRYPGMHDDCMRLAADYYDFACRYLPGAPLERAA